MSLSIFKGAIYLIPQIEKFGCVLLNHVRLAEQIWMKSTEIITVWLNTLDTINFDIPFPWGNFRHTSWRSHLQ